MKLIKGINDAEFKWFLDGKRTHDSVRKEIEKFLLAYIAASLGALVMVGAGATVFAVAETVIYDISLGANNPGPHATAGSHHRQPARSLPANFGNPLKVHAATM